MSDLKERVDRCHEIIGDMCKYSRGPRMSIPAKRTDEDIYLSDTLTTLEAEVENYRQAAKKAMKLAEDALARIPDLEGRVRWLETLNHVAPPALPKEATDERA